VNAVSRLQLRKVTIRAPPVAGPHPAGGISKIDNYSLAAVNLCGERPKSRICDPEHVLSAFVADRQSAELSKLAARSHSSVCMSSRQEIYMALLDVPAKGLHAVATELGHRWGVLGGRCQNGVLVLFSTKTQSVAVATDLGHQVEDCVEKAFAEVPHSSVDNLVASVVRRLSVTLQGNATTTTRFYSKLSWYADKAAACLIYAFGGGLVLGFAVFAALFFYDSIQAGRHRARYNSCHRKLMRVHDVLRACDCQTLCPCCLDPVDSQPAPSVVAFLCGHRYHLTCANNWLFMHKGVGKVCPICDGQGSLPDNVKADCDADATKLFHLLRLHEKYPEIIDTAALKRWCSCHTEIWLSEIHCPPYSSIFRKGCRALKEDSEDNVAAHFEGAVTATWRVP